MFAVFIDLQRLVVTCLKRMFLRKFTRQSFWFTQSCSFLYILTRIIKNSFWKIKEVIVKYFVESWTRKFDQKSKKWGYIFRKKSGKIQKNQRNQIQRNQWKSKKSRKSNRKQRNHRNRGNQVQITESKKSRAILEISYTFFRVICPSNYY